jgi:hypothetical protein
VEILIVNTLVGAYNCLFLEARHVFAVLTFSDQKLSF